MQHSVSNFLSLFFRRGSGMLNGLVKHVEIKSHYKPNLIYNIPARYLTKYTTPCTTYFFSFYYSASFQAYLTPTVEQKAHKYD
jgi:hypothetical protein